MKKVLIVAALCIALILSSCVQNKVLQNMDYGQRYHELTEDGDFLRTKFFDDDAFEYCTGEELDDDEDDMIEYIEDVVGSDVKVLGVEIEDDEIWIYEEMKHIGDFCIGPIFDDYEDSTCEEVADEYGYDDFEELIEDEGLDLELYKNGDKVRSSDLNDYEECYIMMVYGYDEGAYYEVPGTILLVDDELDYEKIANNIIYVDDESEGIIVFK